MPEAPEYGADDSETEREKLREAMIGYVNSLERKAEEQVRRKLDIEERWKLDLRQYYGRYDAATEKVLKEKNRSRLFVNITRAKVHSWEARLGDLLFPVDEKNWGINPTPVPELADQRDVLKRAAEKKMEEANALAQQNPEGGPEMAQQLVTQGNAELEEVDRIKAVFDAADRASEQMSEEIDDQFTEAGYQKQCRLVINDGCIMGAGILKGPLLAARGQPKWVPDPENHNVYKLQRTADPRPTYKRVDPWSYFPDMSAQTPDEREFDFERHMWTKKELRDFAKAPGADRDAIRRLLEHGPESRQPTYLAEVRDITGSGQDMLDERFEVWEYHGPIEAEDLTAICSCMGDDVMGGYATEADPLEAIMVSLWFCQSELIKMDPYPLESGESIYSIWAFEEDHTSVFGRGVPSILRDSQSALNAAWRMIMDNGALSSGPQIIVDTKYVTPQDGSYEMAAFKVWLVNGTVPQGHNPFMAVHIPNNQGALAEIINMALKFSDTEANMPLIAEGGQESHITTTAHGMSLLMNAASVVFRAAVKHFDDYITVPTVRRAYHWNMQHSQKEWIKGDYEVDARGSSVLLVRDIEAQNLMSMALQFGSHPIYGPMTRHEAIYRKLYQVHMLSADEFVKPEEEVAAEMAKNPPPPDPETLRGQTQMQLAQMDGELKRELASMDRDTAMAKLAADQNVSLEKVASDLQKAREAMQSKERLAATEIAVTEQRDQRARVEGEQQPSTGGGYI